MYYNVYLDEKHHVTYVVVTKYDNLLEIGATNRFGHQLLAKYQLLDSLLLDLKTCRDQIALKFRKKESKLKQIIKIIFDK